MELEYVLVQDILEAVNPVLHGVRHEVEATAPPRATETKRKLEADSAGSPKSRAKLYRCDAVDKSLGCPSPAGVLPLLVPQLQAQEAPGPSVVATQPVGHQPAPHSDLSGGPVPRCSDSPHVGGKMLRDTRQHVGSLEELHAQQSVLQAQLRSQISVRLEEIREVQVQQSVLQAGLHSQVSVRLEEIRELQVQESVLQAKLRSQMSVRLEEIRELQVQQGILKVEKRQRQEEHLKKQLENALQEQRKVIQELKSSRQCFEEILQAKDKELERTKEEKDDVVIEMTDVLENELQCIICCELLFEAVTLSCAHSFCQYCIGAWRRRSRACPICQQDILSQTRSLVLDNCIERMVESLSTEVKDGRQALLAERKAALAVVQISDEDTSDSSSNSSSSSSDSDSDSDSESSDSMLDVIEVINTIH